MAFIGNGIGEMHPFRKDFKYIQFAEQTDLMVSKAAYSWNGVVRRSETMIGTIPE